MFVGHFAVAFAAKRAEPRIPLGLLVGAALALDLLWPVLLLLGIETVRIEPGSTAFTPLAFDHYPWTHSLVMATAWGAVLAGLAFPRLRSPRAALVVGSVVVSHWVLDWITHRPDMPVLLDGPKLGLGLWNSIEGTLLVEGLMFGLAVYAYQRAFPPRDRTGAWAFLGLIGFISVMWAMSPWSPPPPSVQAVAYAGLATWLFPFWASWIERHRKVSR